MIVSFDFRGKDCRRDFISRNTSMIHKEVNRRFALEKNKKSFNITSSFSSHSVLFV